MVVTALRSHVGAGLLCDLADNELDEMLRSTRKRRATSVIYGIFQRDHRLKAWNIIYIGQTQDMAKRWNSHWAKARAGRLTPLIAKMRKYPVGDFRMVPLATAKRQEALTQLEDQLIDQYETLVPNGCNILKGHGPQRSIMCSGYAKDIWAGRDFREMRAEFHAARILIKGWQRARMPRLTRLLAIAEEQVAKMPLGWQVKAHRDILEPIRRRLIAAGGGHLTFTRRPPNMLVP
jgi:GIY-YIG catalytic domain